MGQRDCGSAGLRVFEKEAHNETVKLLNSPESTSLFHSYSLTNIDEFFSVAVECFFERSLDFRNYNPKLYSLLAKILKIDPAEMIMLNQVKDTLPEFIRKDISFLPLLLSYSKNGFNEI